MALGHPGRFAFPTYGSRKYCSGLHTAQYRLRPTRASAGRRVCSARSVNGNGTTTTSKRSKISISALVRFGMPFGERAFHCFGKRNGPQGHPVSVGVARRSVTTPSRISKATVSPYLIANALRTGAGMVAWNLVVSLETAFMRAYYIKGGNTGILTRR